MNDIYNIDLPNCFMRSSVFKEYNDIDNKKEKIEEKNIVKKEQSQNKCKDNEKYNKYMQKCVDKNDRRRCHEGYKYDESKKICVKKEQSQHKCKVNEKYNKYMQKCVDKNDRRRCHEGYKYDESKKIG